MKSLIKRTAIRKQHLSGVRNNECSRLFALVTSEILKVSSGVQYARTHIELCGGRVDKNDKVRWTDAVRVFTVHEEPVIESLWDESNYLLTWHSTAVDLMSSVTEGTIAVDITALGDYY